MQNPYEYLRLKIKKADSVESAFGGAEDEIRTRDPRLGKAMLYHWATSAYGGDKQNRTADPLLARQVLSQLSYTPI